MNRLADYFAFARTNPALFVNPYGAGFVVILEEEDIHATELQMAQRLKAENLPTSWAQVGIVYQDQYTMMLRDAVRFPDGSLGTYIRLVSEENSPPGVIILPLHQDHVLLIRHFRHATRTWHMEIPRGFGTQGFSAEENACRELKEEIGAIPSRIVSLGQIYPNTGMSLECDEIFYVEVESYGDAEALEAIAEIQPTPVPEFERMIRENVITDGFTLAAYARAKALGLLT